jgi:TolA-binding protein
MPLRARQVVTPVPRRRRRRRLIWGLAAAALITASGAVASGVVGKPVWRGLSVLASRPAPARGDQAAPSKPLSIPQLAPVAVAAQPAPPVARAPVIATTVATDPVARAPRAPASKPAVAKAAAPASEVTAQEPAVKEPASAPKLFAEANQARRAGDFGRASGLYHLLQDQYPGSAEAELSRVTLALLQLDSGDARGALTGFERYLAGSSRGLEAEALVGRARALGRLGRRDLEVAAWQEVQRKYPRSIYGRQASERLLALGRP